MYEHISSISKVCLIKVKRVWCLLPPRHSSESGCHMSPPVACSSVCALWTFHITLTGILDQNWPLKYFVMSQIMLIGPHLKIRLSLVVSDSALPSLYAVFLFFFFFFFIPLPIYSHPSSASSSVCCLSLSATVSKPYDIPELTVKLEYPRRKTQF